MEDMTMKAIWTKYIGPTNYRGSRVKATAEDRNGFGAAIAVTVGYDDALSIEENHDAAALALCAKMGWPGDLSRGGRPDGCGNVYTFAAECNRVSNPVPSYAEQHKARVTPYAPSPEHVEAMDRAAQRSANRK